MKNFVFFFLAAFLLLFSSCETEALEQDVQQTQLEADLQANKAHAKAVLSFKAHLSGDEEVPAVMTDATGQTIFKLSKDGFELHYKLIVANIENVAAAHIHAAPAGENGGVVAFLYGGGLIDGRTNGILAEGVITADDLIGSLAGQSLEDLVDLMGSGGTYVNVHTSFKPSGEIRGQISANNY
jgi:hypothetical protein